MAKYDKGDVVRVTGSFWSNDPAVLTDPTDSDGSWADGVYESVNVYQRKPDGTTTNLESSINRLSTGKYYVDVTLDQVGTCLLYTSPSPRDGLLSRMPSSA